MRAMVMRRLRAAAGQGWGGLQGHGTDAAGAGPGSGPALRWPAWWGLRLRTLLKPQALWLACSVDDGVAPDEAAPPDGGVLVPPHDQALVQWRAWCAAHEGARCRLALSSRWLLASAHEGGEAEALAASAARWDRYLGLNPADLAARWVVRTSQAHGAVAVVAAPRGLVDDLQAVAAHHHVQVVWMGPWWATEAEHWLHGGPRPGDEPRSAAFEEDGWRVHAQAVGRRLTLLGAEPGAELGAELSAETAAPPDAVPAPLVHGGTQAGEAAAAAGKAVHRWPAEPLPGTPPGPWALALDFAGPRPRAAWWAWALLAAGLAALLAVADQGDRLDAARQEAEAQVRRLERAERQWRLQRALAQREAADREAGDLAGASAQSPGAEPVLDAAAMDDALAMARRLAYPWGAVLDEVEAAAAAQGAVLLGLGIDLEGSGQDAQRAAAAGARDAVDALPALPGASVRLQAAVPDDGAALGWAAALPEGRLLSRATLATPFTTVRGTYTLKAMAQAVMPSAPLILPAPALPPRAAAGAGAGAAPAPSNASGPAPAPPVSARREARP